jgi:hypothetical protein
VSCARESEPSNAPIVVQPKTKGAKCLSQVGVYFSQFKEGQLSQEENAKFWNCLSSAVAEFSLITTGDRNGNYDPAALWRFLHKYFLVGQNVDAGLLKSLMEIKRVGVGGSTKIVTKAELARVGALIEELKALSENLRPHMRIISQTAETADAKEIAEANAALSDAMARLATWVKSNNQTYSFAQMQEFVEGLARNSENKDGWKSWISSIKIISQAKGIVVSLPAEVILVDQWPKIFATISEGYGLLLQAHYQLRGHLIQSLSSPVIRDMAAQIVDMLEKGIRARGENLAAIPVQEFDDLLDAVGEAGWFGKEVKKNALSDAFHWAVGRLLMREDSRVLEQIQTFNLSHIRALRAFLKDWSDLSDFSEHWPNGSTNSERVREFESVLKTSWPLIADKYDRTQYPNAGEMPQYDSHSLEILSWQFLAIAWIRDSYVANGKREMATENMQLAVSEVLPLIQNFNYLLTQKLTVYKRLMKEGDLFMPSSDGNLLIGVAEGTHFLNGIVSAMFAGYVWDDAVGTSCGTPADTACYSDMFYQQRDTVMASMPRLKRMFDGQTLEQWREFFKKIQVTALGDVESEPWNLGDRTLVWMLLDYLENFVQKYDSNQNETISLPEAKVVFATFDKNLQKLFAPLGMPEEEVYPFFTFMMNYGETYFDRFGGQIEFIHWKHTPENWQFESNRYRLTNILFELSKL